MMNWEILYSISSNIRCMKLSTEDLRQRNLSVLFRTHLGPIFHSRFGPYDHYPYRPPDTNFDTGGEFTPEQVVI
jgi:hypothetical protein